MYCDTKQSYNVIGVSLATKWLTHGFFSHTRSSSSPQSGRGSMQLIYTQKFKHGGFVLSLVITKYGTDRDFYVHLRHPCVWPEKLAHPSVFSITRHEARMVERKISQTLNTMLQLNNIEANRFDEELTLVWTYSISWQTNAFIASDELYHTANERVSSWRQTLLHWRQTRFALETNTLVLETNALTTRIRTSITHTVS